MVNIVRFLLMLAAIGGSSLWAAPQGEDDARVDRNMCGLNSLSLITCYLDGGFDVMELDRRLPSDRSPFSVADLDRAASSLGFSAMPVSWSDLTKATFSCPSILHVRSSIGSSKPDHFIACFGEAANGICVADFPARPVIMSRYELSKVWDGDVLYVDSPSEQRIAKYKNDNFIYLTIMTISLLALIFIVIANSLKTRKP